MKSPSGCAIESFYKFAFDSTCLQTVEPSKGRYTQCLWNNTYRDTKWKTINFWVFVFYYPFNSPQCCSLSSIIYVCLFIMVVGHPFFLSPPAVVVIAAVVCFIHPLNFSGLCRYQISLPLQFNYTIKLCICCGGCTWYNFRIFFFQL